MREDEASPVYATLQMRYGHIWEGHHGNLLYYIPFFPAQTPEFYMREICFLLHVFKGQNGTEDAHVGAKIEGQELEKERTTAFFFVRAFL